MEKMSIIRRIHSNLIKLALYKLVGLGLAQHVADFYLNRTTLLYTK